jgi:hypothetical protein
MLRVEFKDVGNTLIMRVEGRLVGPFAKDTRDLVTRCKIPVRLVVNLSEVTFVDAVGEEVLSWLGRIGGEFVAENCYPLHVCERLHLKMAGRHLRAWKAGATTQSKRSIMKWFHSTERGQPQGSLASGREIQSVFAEQRDHLYWIALLITGDRTLAAQAVVDAGDLYENSSSVFRDWLLGWAKDSTVRAAVSEVRDLISASASHYADSPCEHSDTDVLSDDQIGSLLHVDPRDIIPALDPLARSALVLRGIQRTSIADCALRLDVPRRIVAAAYCRALRWNSERAGAHGAPHEKRTVSPILITRPTESQPTTDGMRKTMQNIDKTKVRTR